MKNKKLLKVERIIEIYKKGTDEVIEEINIDHVTLEQLLEIFEPYERGDPLLYDPYDITEAQLDKLNLYLKNPVSYDDTKYEYTLACFGIYVDTKTGKIIK